MTEECSKCRATKKLQYHHISYDPEITIPLCVDCHIDTHNYDHGVGNGRGNCTSYRGGYVCIAISPEFHAKLKSLRQQGESMEAVLKRLIEEATIKKDKLIKEIVDRKVIEVIDRSEKLQKFLSARGIPI